MVRARRRSSRRQASGPRRLDVEDAERLAVAEQRDGDLGRHALVPGYVVGVARDVGHELRKAGSVDAADDTPAGVQALGHGPIPALRGESQARPVAQVQR